MHKKFQANFFIIKFQSETKRSNAYENQANKKKLKFKMSNVMRKILRMEECGN